MLVYFKIIHYGRTRRVIDPIGNGSEPKKRTSQSTKIFSIELKLLLYVLMSNSDLPPILCMYSGWQWNKFDNRIKRRRANVPERRYRFRLQAMRETTTTQRRQKKTFAQPDEKKNREGVPMFFLWLEK